MEAGNALVAFSMSQDCLCEHARAHIGAEHSISGLIERQDDFSDIYYDRSCMNVEEMSVYNFSNIPKEINLEIDQASEDPYFYRTNITSFSVAQPKISGAKQIIGAARIKMDSGKLNLRSDVNPENEGMDDNLTFTNYATTGDVNPYDNQSKMLMSAYSRKINPESYHPTIRKRKSFNKNEGKLIFKITRINRTTHKEKVITKTKRIISKCPHTSLKYYAKGMCKKCYHSFGREKKAYVCGHSNKPLYAKGFCKQCYLSKYKEITFKAPESRQCRRSNNSELDSNNNGLEPPKTVGDLYIKPTSLN